MPALDRLVGFASDPTHAQRIAQTQSYMRCRYMDAVILEMLSEVLDEMDQWEEMSPEDVDAILAEAEEEDEEEEYE